MHPKFQKAGSMRPWFSKNGAHITKHGFNDILSVTTRLNLGFTIPQVWGHLAVGSCKNFGYIQYFAQQP